MKTGIINRQGLNVEQLTNSDAGDLVIFDIGENAGNILLVNNSILIPLINGRTYEINRIRMHLSFFNNAELHPADYAFAQYEQFTAQILIDAFLADSAGTVQKGLFNNMLVIFEGGFTFNIIFQEPFLIDTSVSTATYLKITFKPNDFVFNSISLMTIPPAAGQVINVKGFFALEGVSFTPDSSAALKQISQVESGTGDIPNFIDIDESY